MVAVHKWLFFGLAEKGTFRNSIWGKHASGPTQGEGLRKVFKSLSGKLRTRYPRQSRLQRLYLNINTITIAVILTLCMTMRVQSTVIHLIIDSVRAKSDVGGLSVSFLGDTIMVVPLIDLANRYRAIAMSEWFLGAAIFLSVGSIVV